MHSPPSWDGADRKVHVCENPNLVAIAADRWAPDCAPLVCTDGMPADGELGLRLGPFARRAFPLGRGAVLSWRQSFCRGIFGWEMASGSEGQTQPVATPSRSGHVNAFETDRIAFNPSPKRMIASRWRSSSL
ncbi:MAG: DUF2399 domain-containing protein [Afipia birgiae]|nr:DUF2399 domain-containing protein [Afipia birgiae]